jgi:peptide/nickel transport system substrate-binding protein
MRTHAYDACIFALSSPDADPNADLQVWLSTESMHLWNPEQRSPGTPWEAEIDALMRRQMTVPGFQERKRLFDRVQKIAAEQLPVIPLVSPHVLAAAQKDIGNFQPAPLEPFALWNVEYLYRDAGGTTGRH